MRISGEILEKIQEELLLKFLAESLDEIVEKYSEGRLREYAEILEIILWEFPRTVGIDEKTPGEVHETLQKLVEDFFWEILRVIQGENLDHRKHYLKDSLQNNF